MALNPIETAPNDEEFIVLQDERAEVYEIARWSAAQGKWVREGGEPIQITPTHWMRLSSAYWVPSSSDGFRRREDKGLRLRRFALYAGVLILGSAIFFPVSLGNFTAPFRNSQNVDQTSKILVKTPGIDASLPSQTVASREVASAELIDLHVRSAAEAPPYVATRPGLEAAGASTEQKQEQERLTAEIHLRGLAYAREQGEAVEGSTTSVPGAVPSVQATVAVEQKEALEQERRRGDALARELASAREEIEALKARVVEIAERMQAAQSEQAARASAIEKQVIEQERPRPDGFVAAVTALPTRTSSPAAVGHGSGRPATTQAQQPPVVALGGGTKATAVPLRAIEKEQIAFWVKRGEEFIQFGNFASARLMLQRAAKVGDSRAALMLAFTYDPNVLERFRVKGIAPDSAKARFWYERARTLGSGEAARRLELLAGRAN